MVGLHPDAVQIDPALVHQIIDLVVVLVAGVAVVAVERVVVVDRNVDVVPVGDLFTELVPVAQDFCGLRSGSLPFDGFDHRWLVEDLIDDLPLRNVVAVVSMIVSM